MTEQELWKEFSDKENIKDLDYEAWSFGGDPDRLARLVADGIKTATCSLKLLYDRKEEPLPQEKQYSVILDKRGDAVCIIQTTRVTLCPYCKVTEKHAYLEGEEDRTLESWRKIHYEFFTQELAAFGIKFQEDMVLVCEEFRVVYKK